MNINTEDTDVTEDNRLAPAEKQLSFTTTKADAPAVIFHSEVASVSRALLDHAHTSIEEVRRDDDGSVVAVTGTIPLACFTIKANPKSSGQFNRLVSSGTSANDADGGDG